MLGVCPITLTCMYTKPLYFNKFCVPNFIAKIKGRKMFY